LARQTSDVITATAARRKEKENREEKEIEEQKQSEEKERVGREEGKAKGVRICSQMHAIKNTHRYLSIYIYDPWLSYIHPCLS